jgi:hypothetical protein
MGGPVSGVPESMIGPASTAGGGAPPVPELVVPVVEVVVVATEVPVELPLPVSRIAMLLHPITDTATVRRAPRMRRRRA